MSSRRGDLGRAAIVAVIALALDQASKAIIRTEIERGEAIDLVLGVDLVRVQNDGIAFGLLGGAGPAIIVLAGAAFVVLLTFFLQKGELETLWLPIGLIAGGALGNLVDRITEGSVTDFIDPPRWPAFNVADVEITVGVAILVGLYIRDAVRESPSDDGDGDGIAGAAGPETPDR